MECVRKLRADAASLYVSVFSVPIKTEEALRDPEVRRTGVDLLTQAYEHDARRIRKAGGVVLGAVIHWDETFLHVHVVAIEPKKGRVDCLVPGRLAKAFVNKTARPAEKGKGLGKKANRAYRDAMSGWQDDLHRDVFGPAGLLRFGPGRFRWPREVYKKVLALQREKHDLEETILEHHAWEWDLDVKHEELEVRENRMQEREEALREKKRALAVQLKTLAEDRATAEAIRKAAEAAEKQAREEKEAAEAARLRAEAYARALEVGVDAVDTRQLDYRPASQKIQEGLEFGPQAPETEVGRKGLMAAILPAYSFITRLAKRAFELRHREAVVADETEANKVAARVIAQERFSTGRSINDAIRDILRGPDATYDRASFPGAFFIAADDHDVTAMKERLDAMTNVEVRNAWQATWQSKALCVDQPSLWDELDRGERALEHAASQRGYDLETGRHHPDRAADKTRARLHVDSEPAPLRIIKRNYDKVRTRG